MYEPCTSVVYTVEPVYYGHLGTSQKCPDYQGVLIFQVSLHDNVSLGNTARCVDYADVHIFKCPDQQVPLYTVAKQKHLGCKKVRGQSEATCKQAGATKSFDIS